MTKPTVYPVGRDARVREFLLPTRIMMTAGQVTGSETLLLEKDRQIGLREPTSCTLTNGAEGSPRAALLLDFGREIQGGVRLQSFWLQGGSQLTVRLCFGESCSEALSRIGEKNATNDHAVRDTQVQLTSLSDACYGQTGFRFLYLELVTPEASLPLKAVLGVSEYLDIPYVGRFTCDDEEVNAIYRTAAYTCHLCMQEYLWDGIKRDRLVWVGDMHPEMLTIHALFGAHPLLEKSLRFAREQALLPQWINDMPAYSLWWLLIVRDMAVYSGSKAFAEENRGYIEALLRQVAACVEPDGTLSLPDYFLDWQTRGTLGAMPGVHALMTAAMQAGQKLGTLLENRELTALCRETEQRLASKVPSAEGYKQVTALQYLTGLIGGEDTASLRAGGAAGLSTFTAYYVLKAVSDTGHTAEALQMMKDYYGGMLRMGATTFWEDFDIAWLENAAPIDEIPAPGRVDIHGDRGAFCYEGYRHSLCHGWSSGPVPFLAHCVLGVTVIEDGCRRIRIRPSLGHLQEAAGTVPTPFGPVSVHHRRLADGHVETTYEAPQGVTVELG